MTEFDIFLKRSGLSIAQFHILAEFQDRSQNYADVVINVYKKTRGLSFASSHCEDYLYALEKCLKDKWLHYITPQEEKKQRHERAKEVIPSCDNSIPEAGQIDFFPKSYKNFLHLKSRISGHPIVGQQQVEEAGLETRIFARRAKDSLLFAMHYNSSALYGKGYVAKPCATGPWRFSRFEVVPNGFYCDVKSQEAKR